MSLRRSQKLVLGIAVGGVVALGFGIVIWLPAERTRNDAKLLDLIGTAIVSSGGRRMSGISDAQSRDAIETLRGMGSELDPFLIKGLQVRDGFWRSNYQTFCQSAVAKPFRRRLPSALLPSDLPASVLRALAVRAIGKTGRMTPQIERALITACEDSDSTVYVRGVAAMVLGYKGSRSPEVTCALTQAMQNAQVARIVALGPRHDAFEFDLTGRNVGELIADLARPLPAARRDAAIALRDLGPDAAAAVPALLRTLNESDGSVRLACTEALGAIGPAASNALSKLEELRHEEESGLWGRGERLSNKQFMEKLQHDADRVVARSTIDEAIRRIESPTRQQ